MSHLGNGPKGALYISAKIMIMITCTKKRDKHNKNIYFNGINIRDFGNFFGVCQKLLPAKSHSQCHSRKFIPVKSYFRSHSRNIDWRYRKMVKIHMKIRKFRRNFYRSRKFIPAKFLNWPIRESLYSRLLFL